MSDHAPLYAVLILALGLGIVATPLVLLALLFFDDTKRTLIEGIQQRTSASGRCDGHLFGRADEQCLWIFVIRRTGRTTCCALLAKLAAKAFGFRESVNP
jgi:hypothetical protein